MFKNIFPAALSAASGLAAWLAAPAQARAEVWYLPGWMRTGESEGGGAWEAFTEVFAGQECVFKAWDGDRQWAKSVENADAKAAALAEEIAAMDGKDREGLVLVGHSLGGRIVARVLAGLGRKGLKVGQGMMLAPAIPARDADVAAMGAGSERPALILANPDDITLKYIYHAAGGEGGPALGADGLVSPVPNVAEFSCPEDITDTTEIDAAWGRLDFVKRIANHHAAFYFAELARILDGHPSAKVKTMVPQGRPNLEMKVVDAGVWWDVLDYSRGWKLERHVITRHCRILDPSKHRVAWGSEAEMRDSFAKIRRQNFSRP